MNQGLTAGIVVGPGGSADAERIAHSVRFADEILILEVDAGDPARSRAACRADTFARARHPLVLCLADGEQVSPALQAELAALIALPARADAPAAYRVPRRCHYLGRAVHCRAWQGEGDLRLLDRRRASGAGVVGGRIAVADGAKVGELRGEILWDGTVSLASLLRDLARPAPAAGGGVPLGELATAPIVELWRSFLRGGGVQGSGPGFLLATMDSLETLVRLARRWEAANREYRMTRTRTRS